MNEREMIQSLAVGAQNSNTLGEASASAVTIMGNDGKRVVTKVDLMDEEVVAAKKILERTNSPLETVVNTWRKILLS